MMSKLIAGVGAAAGLEVSTERGGFRSLFTDVFKHCTIVEMESQFAVGTPETTPTLDQVDPRMPAPWVFSRLIVCSVLLTLGFRWGADQFDSDILWLGWIMVGAFGIPMSVLMFFMEANPIP